MQIVIDISENTYQYMKSRFMYQSKDEPHLSIFEKAGIAIKNGIPLPEGHGRLIDADALINSLGASDRDIYCKAIIEEDAPIII